MTYLGEKFSINSSPIIPYPSVCFSLSISNQVRTKSEKSRQSEKREPAYHKTKWEPFEDDLLRKSVEIHGCKNWTAVSTHVPKRGPKQCRERWTAQINPMLSKDEWKEEEDQIIFDKHDEFGNSWARIASFLNGRSANCVKNRFNWLKRKSLVRKESESKNEKDARKPRMLPMPILSSYTVHRGISDSFPQETPNYISSPPSSTNDSEIEQFDYESTEDYFDDFSSLSDWIE